MKKQQPMSLPFILIPQQHLKCCPLSFKAVDTIGNCQRPVFSLGVYQRMHKITNL